MKDYAGALCGGIVIGAILTLSIIFSSYKFAGLEVVQIQEYELQLEGGAVVEVHAIAHLLDNGKGPDYNGGLLVEVWTDKSSYVTRMSLSEYQCLKRAIDEPHK